MLAKTSVSAQIAADLQGRISDASGALVPHATVTLTDMSTNVHQDTSSSDAGTYLFSHLNPGAYQIDVAAAGYEHLSRTGVTATVGQTVSADLVLTVGSEQQTVSVTADAPLLQQSVSDIETHIAGTTVVAIHKCRSSGNLKMKVVLAMISASERGRNMKWCAG